MRREVDGHDLHDFDIAVVFCINDAVCNSGDRQVISHRIQAGRVIGQKYRRDDQPDRLREKRAESARRKTSLLNLTR